MLTNAFGTSSLRVAKYHFYTVYNDTKRITLVLLIAIEAKYRDALVHHILHIKSFQQSFLYDNLFFSLLCLCCILSSVTICIVLRRKLYHNKLRSVKLNLMQFVFKVFFLRFFSLRFYC